MIRLGFVVDRDPSRARVRVKFPDLLDRKNQPVVSWWLPVVTHKTKADQVYWMPDLDEHVIVALFGHGVEDGVVLGAIYSNPAPPPITDPEVAHVGFKDGTVLEYDRAQSEARATLVGDAQVQLLGDLKLLVGQALKVLALEGIELDGGTQDLTGVVTQSCTCAFTGNPHPHASRNVTASRG
jgi:phage baseplate assembly protein V